MNWIEGRGSARRSRGREAREGTYFVNDQHFVVNLDAQVVRLYDQLVLARVTITRKVRIWMQFVVFDPLASGNVPKSACRRLVSHSKREES